MSQTKKKTTPKAVRAKRAPRRTKAPTPPAPLTWKELQKWDRRYHLRDAYGEMRRARIDPRLIALTYRASGGVLHGLTATRSTLVRRQLLDFAAAEGSAARGDHELAKRHAWIVTDWLVRCVLPFGLQRLPSRYSPAVWAATFRALGPLIFTVSNVNAMHALAPLWGALTDDGLRDASARERPVIMAVQGLTTAVMRATARTVLDGTGGWTLGTQERVSHCLEAASTASTALGVELIEPLLPDLLRLLSEVQSEDGQKSIASRCVWPTSLPVATKAA